jgi:uncharacterized protein (DUF2141 family)
VDPSGGRVVITDDAGRFVFNELPAGRYMLNATRPGFVSIAYGAKRPERPGAALSLDEGQRLTGVTVRMLRGAVITGTVRDENGDPIADQFVNVMRYGFSAQTGERLLQSYRGPLGYSTDDRGMYRIFDLAPGEYFIVVTQGLIVRTGTDVHQVTAAEVQWATQQLQGAGRGGAAPTPPPTPPPNVQYAPVFFPGSTTEEGATMITLGAGEERSGVDVSLSYQPTSTISGHVVAAAGGAPPPLQVLLLGGNQIEGLPFSGFTSAPVVLDGTYKFTGVMPGHYTVTARPTNAPPGRGGGAAPLGPADLAQFAIAEVTVNGQDATADLTLQPGVTVSGHLAFSGTTPPPAALNTARVSMSAVVARNGAAVGVPAATVDATGQFSFSGVAPGRYRLTASMPGSTTTTGWQVQTAMIDGRDALDVPVEVGSSPVTGITVTFTDRLSELNGRIADAAGRPAAEYFIILFSTDNGFWTPQSRRIQSKRPGSDGRFSFVNLPPGRYHLAAVTDVDQGQWFDPTFLAQLVPAAIGVTITAGEKTTQDIQIAASR